MIISRDSALCDRPCYCVQESLPVRDRDLIGRVVSGIPQDALGQVHCNHVARALQEMLVHQLGHKFQLVYCGIPYHIRRTVRRKRKRPA